MAENDNQQPMTDSLVFSIENATRAHCDLLAALHETSFDKFWKATEFATMFDHPGTHAAIAITTDGQPLGFILTRSSGEEAEILTFCVDPARRKQKIAKRLLRHMCEQCKGGGIKKMFLEVMEDNEPALGLYRGCGFMRVGERPGYYHQHGKPAQAAIVMELDI